MPEQQTIDGTNIGGDNNENNSTDHTGKNTVIAYAQDTEKPRQEKKITTSLEYGRHHLGRDDLTDGKIQAVFDGARPPELGVLTDTTGHGGVEEIRAFTRDEGVDHVVVTHITQFSDSLRDVYDVISDLNKHGATVHAVEDDLVITPGDDKARRTLRAAATREERAVRRELPPVTVNTDTWTGRPPLGYDVVNGQLRPGDEYDTVCERLERVGNHDMSKRAAAEELGTTRRTITKCLEERRDMYELDDQE